MPAVSLNRARLLRELQVCAREHKAWWIVFMVVILLLVIFFLVSVSTISPFIYSLF